MAYQIISIPEIRGVFLSCDGELAVVEMLAARYEADAILDKRRWRRLVVDVSLLTISPTLLELYALATGLSSHARRAERVALVVRSDQERHATFVQDVARRAQVALACFLAPDEAIRWVTSTAAGPARES